MMTSNTTDRLTDLKTQARRLRRDMAETGRAISHGQALEMIAHQQGARDWNTLSATVRRNGNKRPFAVGDRVEGQYLGQPFTGYVHGLSVGPQGKYQRITLHFDEPVDVVTFDSFSSFRQRVSAVIDDEGRSLYRISSGAPQLVLHHVGL
ncbi:hypothetical protein GI582_14470 [Sulfitobacter sp. BDSS02]|nr:hypothetical protein [Sulfitobacter sp. BDSS02]MBR9851356.1 hypothetical protein [Paracoccaceae bacterium]